jgi:hypothetical protein
VSQLIAVAKLRAVQRARACPIATVRHRHLSDRPMVFIPLVLAGEAAAPLAALIGDDRDRPELLIVAQPRDRDLRFGFVAELAARLLPYLEGPRGATGSVGGLDGEPAEPAADAPQLLVPGPGGVAFLRLLGRATRFRGTAGEHAVSPAVPRLGRFLTFLADRAEYPGSSLVLPITDVLRQHWATGQSDVEDANLAALLGWIAPPHGQNGPQAAALAEDPLRFPPAGPHTDPGFDNEVLAPAVTAYGEAGSPAARERAVLRLRTILMSQLEPTWRLMWQAFDLLRRLPAAGSDEQRWLDDRWAYSAFCDRLAEGALPQARRDSAVAAAARLSRLERSGELYDVQRAYDDPLVMAEHRLSGAAFGGVVVSVEPDRLVAGKSGRRMLRPLLAVETNDPVAVEAGEEVHLAGPRKIGARVVGVDDAAGGGPAAWPETVVTLEICKGMGTVKKPAPLPEPGEQVCFTTLKNEFQPPQRFPDSELTPWTHGGPPAETPPSRDDSEEAWS